MNKITIIGNLGTDPEMRYTPQGEAVTSFSVASNRRYKTASGEQKDETMWFRVSTWGKLAEICNEHLSKGQQVYVEGRIRVSEYSDRSGEKRFGLDVVASELHFLGAKPKSDDSDVEGVAEHGSNYEAAIAAGHRPVESESQKAFDELPSARTAH